MDINNFESKREYTRASRQDNHLADVIDKK